jgi:hypothetical protein
MPQASEELRVKFPGWDEEAHAVLEANFTEKAGIFRPKIKGYKPTPREDEALDYMFHEWNYGYEPE